MADIELDSNPTSTWGASEAYKQAWNEKYGNTAPAKSASKAEWVDFAVTQGVAQEDAEGMTRDELVEKYADAPVMAAPAQGSSTPAAETLSGSPEPGAGVDSGTVEGTAATTSTPRTGK